MVCSRKLPPASLSSLLLLHQGSALLLPSLTMDYSNTYSLPTASNTQYEYVDDGLGGLMDDGLGSSYDMPQSSLPPLDDTPLDYFDNFAEPAAPPQPTQQPASSTPAAQSSQQPADDADDGGLDAELEAELDKAFAEKPAAEASKSQQMDEDSDVETIDEAADSDGDDTRSREGSQQAEDPAQAEQQKQNAWYKECYDTMTEAQRNRLEAYNRSNLQRKTMKKVLQELTGSATSNDKLLIALSAVTKMFVGELVATGRQVAACQGHTGALLPSHIRAAYQLLSEDGKVPHKLPSKPLRLC